MTEIRIAPELTPLGRSLFAHKLVGLFTRSAAMGLLSGPPITRLDPASVRRLVKGLQRHGIAGSAGVSLALLLQEDLPPLDAAASQALEDRIDQVTDALEASAAPAAEWPAMRHVFGDEVLAGLLEVSLASLRRYAIGERETPVLVASRLHWLALVVAHLSGAYNDFGIRRWFERPRVQLDGLSPRAALGAGWHPDDDGAGRVLRLAATLTGAQPLAV